MSRILLAIVLTGSSLFIGGCASETEQARRTEEVRSRQAGITNNVEARAERRKIRHQNMDERYDAWFDSVMD